MTVSPALQWFLSQSELTLTNPLTRVYLLAVLNDASNSLTEMTRARPLRLSNAAQVNRLLDVTAANTELLARVGIDWLNPLERAGLASIVAAMSLLPYQANFAALPDGSLPAVFTGGTWTIVGGVVINTLGMATNRLTDGGYENWTTPTNLTSWTESLAGTSIVTEDLVEMRSGSKCARYDVDASNSLVTATQVPAAIAIGDWVLGRVWMKSSAASGKSANLRLNAWLNEDNNHPLTNVYAEYLGSSLTRVTAGANFGARQSSAASSSIYVDDASFYILDKTAVHATADFGQADVTVKANWTCIPGALAGVIMNLDSTSNPLNYVVLVVDASQGQTFLWKVINGVPATTVQLGAITYVAGAAVELRKSGTTYQVYYNSIKVGTDQTISDAGIISNTRHGMLSVYSGNQCSFFSAA